MTPAQSETKYGMHAGQICKIGRAFEHRGETYFTLHPVNGDRPNVLLKEGEFSRYTDSENCQINNALHS